MSDCSAEPGVPWVAAVVTFLVIAVAAAALVLAVVYRKRISNFLCPKDLLPQRFKEVCVHTSARICVRTSVTTECAEFKRVEESCEMFSLLLKS